MRDEGRVSGEAGGAVAPRFCAAAAPAFLEHYPDPGGVPHRVPIDPLPFRIGRSAVVQYVIYSPQVSKEHSEIFRVGKEFRIRDLGSTNGTFVNGQRVTEAALVNGDIIHVAHKELRFGFDPGDSADGLERLETEQAGSMLPASIIRGSRHLRELLSRQAGRIVFQPIVYLDTGAVFGFEALGRGTHPELSADPSELFRLADQCNLASELSQMFRAVALEQAPCLAGGSRLFLNIHPAEMGDEALPERLRELKGACRPEQWPVLEVHEGFAADLTAMRGLRERLKESGIGLAYDDFGAGQSRLAEPAEVPPDFVKLDRGLVHGIDAAEPRQALVRAINRVINDLGGRTIAEGIETAREARTCRELGCTFGQGYLYGPPQPGPAWAASRVSAARA